MLIPAMVSVWSVSGQCLQLKLKADVNALSDDRE